MTVLIEGDIPLVSSFMYTNWKGRKAMREVMPLKVYWGKTEYHPEEQWLLRAYDYGINDYRDFALKDMTIEAN